MMSEPNAKYCADRSASLDYRHSLCGRSNFRHANSRVVGLPGCRVTNYLLRSDIMLMQVSAETFTHSLTIYLKDSNAYGNTYFARYFEWQGICREKWFFECISRDMLQKEGVFITKHAEQDYLHETFPFQEISCELNAYDVKKCSFWLEFRFYAEGKRISVGRQQIVFANHAKQITALPEAIIASIKRYVK
ncbi:acyl-CoA thioesterase [Duganella margarita]|nr:acyl-CoA thioesterase [Duganella margarita]